MKRGQKARKTIIKEEFAELTLEELANKLDEAFLVKKEFFRRLKEFGWEDVKKATKGKKGIIKILKRRKFKVIKLPHLNENIHTK